jgi:hypothetical protein
LLSYIFNIIGEKNVDHHFPDLGRLEATLQRHHSCFSKQHLQKRYCCQSVKSCTLTTLPLLQSLQTGIYNIIQIILFMTIKTRAMQSVAYTLTYKFDPVTLTFDLWPWKSIGFQTLLRTNDIPSLVKIHWRMLILECSQGCYGRTEGEGIISQFPSSKYSKSIFDCDFFYWFIFLFFVF